MERTYLDIYPPSSVRVRITLPASKSISNRALVINALSRSGLVPENLSDCDDTRVMIAALQQMPEVIDIGAAGTAMRFLTAYLAVTPGTHVITGTARMQQRPIAILVDALRALGAQIEYVGKEGFPPLRIQGTDDLQGGELALPGNVSSQYISALLMIAPTLQQGLRLTLTGNVISRPYIDMTIAMMREFGAAVEWEGSHVVAVRPRAYRPVPYCIENDWSAASYWYEIVALSKDADAEVVLPGLHRESLQGDSRVQDYFQRLGVTTTFETEPDGKEVVRLRKSPSLLAENAVVFDLVNQPDLAQTLVVTCAMLGLPFQMSGLQSLKIKETDRIAALRNELQKLGVEIKEENEGVLVWDGIRNTADETAKICTYDDHRMAMAFAPACMASGCLRILAPQVVTKSYPTYWNDLEKSGFKLCEM